MGYEVREESLPAVEEEWQELLPASSASFIFTNPRWRRLWEDHFGWGPQAPVFCVRQGPQLVAVAPLVRQGEGFALAGDDDLWDYRDLVLARGEERPALQALFDYLETQPWARLELSSLRADSPTLHILPSLARERGYRVEKRVVDVCPRVELGDSWQGFLSALGKKDRHELRRKLRRLAQAGSSEALASHPSALPQDMEAFLGLMRKSPEKAGFLTQEREAFFRGLAASFGPEGSLRLFFLEIGGQRAAAALCFDQGEELALYNSGFDPAYASLSAGLLLKAFCIKEAIALGKRRFNFLRGSEAYKYDLGGKDLLLYSLSIARP